MMRYSLALTAAFCLLLPVALHAQANAPRVAPATGNVQGNRPDVVPPPLQGQQPQLDVAGMRGCTVAAIAAATNARLDELERLLKVVLPAANAKQVLEFEAQHFATPEERLAHRRGVLAAALPAEGGGN